MAETAGQFLHRFVFKLGVIARVTAGKAARSATIQKSLRVIRTGPGQVAVEAPYYWAIYYHDGRGAIRARPGHKLVYFRSPDQDPRINFGARNYPVREADIVKLTKKQFYTRLRNPASGMIVADSVGPTAGDPFFTRGLRRFPDRASLEGAKDFSRFVRETIGPKLLRAQVRTVFRI